MISTTDLLFARDTIKWAIDEIVRLEKDLADSKDARIEEMRQANDEIERLRAEFAEGKRLVRKSLYEPESRLSKELIQWAHDSAIGDKPPPDEPINEKEGRS